MNKIKIALILSGCGVFDGAEIREAVIALLALDRAGAEVKFFAPDINQTEVINHLTNKKVSETRNVLVESARIARGDIKPLQELDVAEFDGVVIPGGFGVAKNLSNLAEKGKDAEVNPEFRKVLQDFIEQKKPIGAICISPAVLVAAVRDQIKPKVTIGDDNDNLITALGGESQKCTASEISYDKDNKIASCAAYMTEEPISKIAEGIEKVVNKVVEIAGSKAGLAKAG